MVAITAFLLIADWPWSTDVRVDDATTGAPNETAFTTFGAGWNDDRGSYYRYGFSSSDDSGETWGPDQLHHYNGAGARDYDCDPVIGVDAYGNLHEIILNYDYSYNGLCVHRVSTDNGNTWSDFHIVSQNNGSGLPDKPWMTFSPSTDTLYAVHVLFYGSDDGTYACRSTNGGTTWTAQKVSTSGTSSRPFICTDQAGNVFVIWLEWYSQKLYLSYSTDGGSTYTSPSFVHDVVMNPDHRPSQVPWMMGGPPGTLYLTWPDEMYSSQYQYDVVFTKSTDYGATWTTPVAVNTETGRGHKAFLPSIAVTPGGDLIMVWAQYQGGNWSLEYAYSVDGGDNWNITTNATGRVSDVDFSIGDGMEMGDYLTAYADSHYVYALWSDARDGRSKIYFSKASLEELIPTSARERANQRAMGVSQTRTSAQIDLTEGAMVEARLYDATGRMVRNLFKGELSSGTHEIGLPDDLAPGIYMMKLRVDSRSTSLKFLVD